MFQVSPKETFLVGRAPAGNQVVEALRKRAVIFTEEVNVDWVENVRA